MKKTTYTINSFLNALKKAGLPYSKPSIMSYEKKGIISFADEIRIVGKRKHRIYTALGIKKRIQQIRKYKKGR